MPAPKDIENDEQMHQANAMIRGMKFKGQFNDPNISGNRGASNGSAFIECKEIPEQRIFYKGRDRDNKPIVIAKKNGCMSIEYNLEHGSIQYQKSVEFSAYYHKFKGVTYGWRLPPNKITTISQYLFASR